MKARTLIGACGAVAESLRLLARPAHFRRLGLYGYDSIRLLLAVTLLAAAGLKGYELSTSAVPEDSVWNSRYFLIPVTILELAFGLWLLIGLYPRWTRLVALVLFVCLFEMNLYWVLGEEVSCPCFGKVALSPWVALTFDCLAVCALLALPPRGATPPKGCAVRCRLAVFGTLLMLVGVPAGLTMVYYTTGGLTTYLRTDARLQKRVKVDLRYPTSADLLGRLHSACDISLTIDPRLDVYRPDYGRVGPGTFRVCAVMDMMSQKQYIPARWITTEGGYELARVSPWESQLKPWLISAVIGGCLLFGTGLVRIRSAFPRSGVPQDGVGWQIPNRTRT